MKETAKILQTSPGVVVDAMIQYNSSGYHRHRLRDIRPESAFVEMGNVRVLRKDSLVRVVFVHKDAGESRTHLLEAKVTRVDRNGALLKFIDLDEPAQYALERMQGHRLSHGATQIQKQVPQQLDSGLRQQ